MDFFYVSFEHFMTKFKCQCAILSKAEIHDFQFDFEGQVQSAKNQENLDINALTKAMFEYFLV